MLDYPGAQKSYKWIPAYGRAQTSGQQYLANQIQMMDIHYKLKIILPHRNCSNF